MALGSATHKHSSCAISSVRGPHYAPRGKAYPKRPIPAGYGSVVFQKPLLDDSGLLGYPPPLVSCSGFCERMTLGSRGMQRYRISKMGSSVLGHR